MTTLHLCYVCDVQCFDAKAGLSNAHLKTSDFARLRQSLVSGNRTGKQNQTHVK